MATLESTRASSSTATAYWSVVPPAPPTSSGKGIPIQPSSPIARTIAYGNALVRSSSPATGATSLSANSRTVRRSSSVSSGSSKCMPGPYDGAGSGLLDRLQRVGVRQPPRPFREPPLAAAQALHVSGKRSEEHTSELQSRQYLVCRLL